MNAPTPTTAIQQNISLGQLFPSPTNPRKRFDETKLKELAASIKMQGVLQPILVRTAKADPKARRTAGWPFPTALKPKPETEEPPAPAIKYEVIAGERRFRAASLAGLTEVPCFVRELTDLQVLHAQVIENLQRDDLHPIEEAEGYETLMQQTTADGTRFSADSIAAEVGKSRAYVYGRLKLLDLCHEARDSHFNGEIDASTALLIARIPTQLLQIEALTSIIEDELSYRAAKEHIQHHFMLDLATAKFDIKDAKLVSAAGACVACIKRTGNQPELFDDVSSKDVCTDTACFANKKAAHYAATLKNAEASGNKVILKEEAKELMPYRRSPFIELRYKGLAQLSDRIPNDEAERTWEDALTEHKLLKPAKGKPVIGKTLIENPHEEGIIETINIEEALKALREAGFEVQRSEASQQREQQRALQQQERQQKQEQQETQAEHQNKFRAALFDTLHQRIQDDPMPPKPHVADGLYRIMAEIMFDQFVGEEEDVEMLAKRYAPDLQPVEDEDLAEAFIKHIPNLTTQQHFTLMLDSIMIDELTVNRWRSDTTPTRMLAIAKEIGIDAEAIEQAAAGKPVAKKGKVAA